LSLGGFRTPGRRALGNVRDGRRPKTFTQADCSAAIDDELPKPAGQQRFATDAIIAELTTAAALVIAAEMHFSLISQRPSNLTQKSS